METCLLLIDTARSGQHNMAADEWCAFWAARHQVPVLRLYRWEPATLSLGYFQNWRERERHPASLACPLVRRPSGGGAIIHDREWTYALALPRSHPLARERLRLYFLVHETLVAWLKDRGVEAFVLRSEDLPSTCEEPRGGRCPFLCFQRRSVGDIVCDVNISEIQENTLVFPDETFSAEEKHAEKTEALSSLRAGSGDRAFSGQTVKLVGSAQWRTREAVLQHGSILLGRSAYAPELPGVWEVLGNRTSLPWDHDLFRDFATTWPLLVAEALGWRFSPLCEQWENDPHFAKLLERFASHEWTYKSDPPPL